MFDRIIAWIATTKYFYAAIASAILIVLLIIILTVGSCGRRDTAQVEQGAASAQAANAAGAAAVNTASSVAAAEAVNDTETRRTVEKINESNDPDAVRSAVIDRLCRQETNRLDPACSLRRSGAR